MMQSSPAIFEEREIRRVYDEATETWLLSGIDNRRALGQFKTQENTGVS